jgi:hypothetical protein
LDINGNLFCFCILYCLLRFLPWCVVCITCHLWCDVCRQSVISYIFILLLLPSVVVHLYVETLSWCPVCIFTRYWYLFLLIQCQNLVQPMQLVLVYQLSVVTRTAINQLVGHQNFKFGSTIHNIIIWWLWVYTKVYSTTKAAGIKYLRKLNIIGSIG